MAPSISSAYAALQDISKKANFTVKGDIGEEIVLALARKYQKKYSSIVIHSYKYPYAVRKNGEPHIGNIKLTEKGEFYNETSESYEDEIDVLLITDYRIFIFEVKARTGKWVVTDDWITQNNKYEEKSPVCQVEKHARHFYHQIYEWIPNGRPEYIIPVLIFVDKATIDDSRSESELDYINITIADRFSKLVKEKDTPLEYAIDKEKLVTYLRKIGTLNKLYV